MELNHDRRPNSAICVALGATVLLLVGCGREPEPPRAATPEVTPGEPRITREELANLAYPSELGRDGRVQLRDGVYEQAEGEDPASKLVVKLTRHVAYGDLNNDGREDAAVILESDSGGTGSFMDVAAVLNTPQGPRPVAVIDLGDRTEIRSLEVQNESVFVNLIGHGPEDPVCCPTQLQRREYRFDGSRLLANNNAPPP